MIPGRAQTGSWALLTSCSSGGSFDSGPREGILTLAVELRCRPFPGPEVVEVLSPLGESEPTDLCTESDGRRARA
jgi:hypothetical protein